MKRLLPTLLLLLPLHAAVAQYHPSYSPPVRTFTPTPYQTQQRTQQYAHETFQRMQSQQLQQMQQRSMQLSMARLQAFVPRRPLSPEQLAQVQTRQQQAEQKATAQLTQLAQQQQQRRQEHPAPDAEQAAAQQAADTKQLTVLTVKIYREVFLPNQLFAVLQSLTLPAEAQHDWQALNGELLSSAWWSQQAGQAPAAVAARSATLRKLTTALLGFDPAAPAPAAPAALDGLSQQLAQDRFDRLAAAQLLAAAAQADKQAAGVRLAQAVQEFHILATSLVAAPAGTPAGLKQQRHQVKHSLRHVNQELARYQAHVTDAGNLNQARKTILTATADYLAKNSSKG